MAHPDIHALAQQWLTEALEELEERLCAMNGYQEDEGFDMALTEALRSTAEQLMENDFSQIKDEVDGLLKGEGVDDLPKDLYRRLCREVLKAKQIYLREEMQRGEGLYTPNGFNVPSVTKAAPVEKKPTSPLFSKVILEFLKAFERRAPGTIEAKKNVFKRFLSIIGDKPLSSISDRDIARYRDTLTQLPTNMSKRYPGKTVIQVLKLIDGKDVGLISLATANMDLTHLRHLFKWSISKPRRYLQENPVEGLFFEDVDEKNYEPFTDEDLDKIFSSDEWQSQRRRDVGKFWLPLVLYLSGCRREEIANMTLADIKTDEGIVYFDVAPDPKRGRRLKTKSSRRIVPLHSTLEKLGFLEYVNQRIASGQTLIFEKGTTVGRKTVGDLVSKWFTRLMRSKDIKPSPGKLKAMKSFRSSFITKLHELGVDPETRRELTGHVGKDVHEQVYLRPSLPLLKRRVDMLQFHWLTQ